MRFTIRTAAAVLLTMALCLEGTSVWGRMPVPPIPSYRQPPGLLSPKAGVLKNPIMAHNSKGGKQKGWSPFGGRARKTAGRIGMAK